MSEKDQLIRKMWIVSSIVIHLGTLFLTYIQNVNWVGKELLFYAYSAFFTLFSTYLYYRCAYKKPGTKLLTYMLFAMPIFLLFNGIQVATGHLSFLLSSLHPLQLIPMIWLYILSWKLRKINKKLQGIPIIRNNV
jgi:hypothetical protein